jgi:superfamily I DNA/RNA helicase
MAHRMALRACDIDTTILQPQKADDRRKSGVRMATMHRSKGLESTAIAIVRVNDDTVPPKWLLNQAPDAAIKRSIVNAEKSLTQVAATRAKKRMFLSSSGHPSELIWKARPVCPPSKPIATIKQLCTPNAIVISGHLHNAVVLPWHDVETKDERIDVRMARPLDMAS